MATTSGFASSRQRKPAESLLTLAEYLELALDEGACVVLMRNDVDVCAVCIGDPAGSQDALAGHGTIAVTLVNEILELTEVGINRIEIGDRTYRFFRSFTQIADFGAVVFAPA
jgi:hypothetical protein